MDFNDKNAAPPSYAEVTGGQNSSSGQPLLYQPPGHVPTPQAMPQTHYQQFPSGFTTQTYYQHQPIGNVTTVIVTSAPNLNIFRMASGPVNCQCPSCGMQVITKVSTTPGALAFLICTLLALFGLWLGCCLIPFCIYECMDVEHYCPNCKRLLGVCRRL